MAVEKPQWKELFSEVVTSGLCTGCAACVVACPHDVLEYDADDGDYKPFHLDIDGGPRRLHPRREGLHPVHAGVSALSQLGERDRHAPLRARANRRRGLGHRRRRPRARDRRVLVENGQDGGFVSALLIYALEHDVIDAALVSGLEGDGSTWRAEPAVARTRDDVVSTRRSRATPTARTCSPTTRPSKAAPSASASSAWAAWPRRPARCRRARPARSRADSRSPSGCSAPRPSTTRSSKELFEANYGIERADIKKMNIKGVFQLWTNDGGYHEVPLKEAHAWTREGCTQCPDFAAEHADLSTGGIGAFSDWTLVIVRTDLGRELLDAMKERAHRDSPRRRRPRRDRAAAQARQRLAQALARDGRPGPRTPPRACGLSERADHARPFTTVLLVRHGTTATTGKVLPGRAPGLHLSERGTPQAEAVAERLAELSNKPDRALRLAPRARPETAAPIAKALRLRATDRARAPRVRLRRLDRQAALDARAGAPSGDACSTRPSTFRFPEGESFTEMQVRMWDAGATRRASTAPHRRRREPRRPHQGGRRLRPGRPARPLPAHRHLPVLGERRRRGRGAPIVLCVNSTGSLEGSSPVVNYGFRTPTGSWSACAARSAIGSSSSKCARDGGSSSSSARRSSSPPSPSGSRQVLSELGRPGHLPEDFALEPEYESDFVAGEIAVVDRRGGPDDRGHDRVRRGGVDAGRALTREWAGGLAIAIVRLVEAGRPLCPLCGGPLDPRGHDCPRTNGHRAPIR